MLKEMITLDETIKTLNEALTLDKEGVTNFILTYARVNHNLAVHPTIQVNKNDGTFRLGMLGFLNGLFGISETGFGALGANFQVICPNECEELKGRMVDDNCPTCGDPLILGELQAFSRTSPDLLYREVKEKKTTSKE